MAINDITNLDLGTFLQKIYSAGIFHQTSRDYSDWEMIKMNALKISPGRSYDFQLSTSLAPASTQRRDPGSANRAFPKGFRIKHSEFSAVFKEIQSTIEVDGQLLARAAETAEKYAEVWATQAGLSLDGARRVMAAELYQDGTGALGHVSSSVISGGDVTITLKANQRNSATFGTYGVSYAGWFLLGDVILPLERDTSASAMVGATYLEVTDVDELNGTVTFTGLDASFNEATITTAPAANEVLYRFDQQTFVDFSAAISDFGDVATPIVGLESLAAKDGRVTHGMTLSGALAGTQIDAGGESIDIKFLEQALNRGKRRVGNTQYDWKKLCTSYQTRSAFIESKDADRRFIAVTDNSRGSGAFNFVHGKSTLELTTSEFIPEDALWILPEQRGTKEKVLEYVGDEMKVAKYGNMPDFHFKHNSNGQRVDVVEQHMRGVNLLICKHPAAVLSVVNFKNQ